MVRDKMDVAIPAMYNPRIVWAAIARAAKQSPDGRDWYNDEGGSYKKVWLLGRVVLKHTAIAPAWRELYPQFFSPLSRQVIQPYRAWMTAGSYYGGRGVWMVQARLVDSRDRPPQEGREQLDYMDSLYREGMKCRDVKFSSEGHRNAGTNKHGKLKVFDFGCGEHDDCDDVRLEDGHMVGRWVMKDQDYRIQQGW